MKVIQWVAVSLVACVVVPVANAVPKLQLDIAGGVYDPQDETTFAPANAFTLYALNAGLPISGNFYLSAAVTPMVAPANPPPNLGYFTLVVDRNADGVVDAGDAVHTVQVVGGMTYGVPPLESLGGNQGFDAGDLSKHGIFETYFAEFSFKFNANLKTQGYDVQKGTHPALPTAGTPATMYYQPFLVDLSGLAPGYGIHFDLYSEVIKSGTDIDADKFAPFSHDAAGWRRIPDGGATAVLLGLGVLGIGILARNRI
ncbi:MAG: choice-of-anchor N protein [Verrucomicrobia bacterium]|nr:choice-of-anchor N protein [Verrucomicrobiota bacterium]